MFIANIGTLRDQILSDAKSSQVFGVQADETTDVSVKCQLISYITYLKVEIKMITSVIQRQKSMLDLVLLYRITKCNMATDIHIYVSKSLYIPGIRVIIFVKNSF